MQDRDAITWRWVVGVAVGLIAAMMTWAVSQLERRLDLLESQRRTDDANTYQWRSDTIERIRAFEERMTAHTTQQRMLEEQVMAHMERDRELERLMRHQPRSP